MFSVFRTRVARLSSDIPLSLVKELRSMTSAGLMDCKKALAECGSDTTKAAEWLRRQGLAKAGKRAGKAAAAGAVGVFRGPGGACVVEVNAETDFAARTDAFSDLVGKIGATLSADVASAASDAGAAEGAISAARDELCEPLRVLATELSGVTGEKVQFRRSSVASAGPSSIVGTYVHQPFPNDARLGTIGALVTLRVPGGGPAPGSLLQEAADKVAMHVAAMDPAGVSPESIPEDIVAAERDALEKQAREGQAGKNKPDEVVAKIVDGRMRKWLSEVALTEQVFCLAEDPKSPNARIGKMVEPAEIVAMERFRVGDGIEVEEVDFADEVAKEMGKGA